MTIFPHIRSLSNEDYDKFPQHAFPGTIHVIDSLEKMKHAVQYLSHCKILGFDTETRPSFKKGLSYPLALLQLSDDSHAFLFRLQSIGISKELADILSSPTIIKVGAAIRDDLSALTNIRKFTPQNFIDIQTVAKQLEIENFGLKKLSPLILGFRISKRQQLSNWDTAELNDAQKLYAATDAWVSLKIFETLLPYLNDSTLSETK